MDASLKNNQNLKQYSDYKFACIKCEKQLTVEKEVGEHMDTEDRPVHDGRETDNLNFSETIGSSSPLGSEDAAASKVKDVDLSDIILAEEDITEVLSGFIEIDPNIPKTEFLGSEDLKQENNEYYGDGDSCDQCDCTTTLKSNLKTHQQNKHQAHYLNNSGSSSPLAEDDVLIDTAASNVKDVDLSEAVQVSVSEEDVKFLDVLIDLKRENNEYLDLRRYEILNPNVKYLCFHCKIYDKKESSLRTQ